MKDPSIIHTFESCQLEAKKYRSKKDFRSKSSNVWAVAVNNGWIKKICSHMIPQININKDIMY